ncbi:MAG: hypothetical protein AB2417_15850 [Clostridiaceae bacterium]
MLKENGKVKKVKNEYVKCKFCSERIDIIEAKENGYIQKVRGASICDCPYCDKQFSY